MSPPVSSHALLEGFSIRVALPLTWGQMDAFAHVNNTQYFRWFEDVRMAYFQACGIFDHMSAHQVGPILARTLFPALTAWHTSSTFSADVSACPIMPPMRGFD